MDNLEKEINDIKEMLITINKKIDILVGEKVAYELKRQQILKQLDEYYKYLEEHPEEKAEMQKEIDEWMYGFRRNDR
jgi:regulator of replication initiation timing